MGLSDFRKLRERLAFVPTLLPTLMGDAVVAHEGDVLDLIREQLQKGETPEATPIRPAYKNPDYARKKQLKNPKPTFGTPDLKNTGEFYRGFKLDVFADGFEPRGTDKKTPDLLTKYGAVIGLSSMSKARLQQQYLKPYLQRKLKSLL